MSFWHKWVDERFLVHRQRSTSTAGIVTALAALGLFAFHYYVDHQWRGELLAVACAFLVVKVALMLWYFLTD